MSAAGCIEDAEGLASAIAVEERILFGIGESFGKLRQNIVFKVESVVVKQFFGDLHSDVKLVRIENNLREGRVSEGEGTALLNPGRGRFRSCDVDFVFAACFDGRAEFTEDILLGQTIDQAAVILIGDKITTVCVNAFLQDIADSFEVGAQGIQHCLFVFGSSRTRLDLHAGNNGFAGKRAAQRLGQLTVERFLLFQTVDFLTECNDISFHFVIGDGIFGGDQAVRTALCVEESLRRFPCLVPLLAQFKNFTHCVFPPKNLV
ncbi:hypothetical protein SDC9_67919 [bioreactor metagenome]|uniref:Uncharacterized protein n=1 Tax=bioreactor metagenome TaxID=1076179 RepID=A0A644XYZ1_9ZZZZ